MLKILNLSSLKNEMNPTVHCKDTTLEPTNFLIALRFVSSLNDTKKAEFLFWDALTFMAFVLKDQRPDMFVYVIGPEGKDFWYRLY